MHAVTGRRRAPVGRSGAQRDEGGYIAVMTGLLLMVLVGLSAFAVDVGHWYYVGQKEQRAADAAALAGVTSLPGDQAGAFSEARTYATANGYTAGGTQTVTPSRNGATQLRVEVSENVDNFFGGFFGLPKTKVARHAVAEFAGPVPMGSPCNRFGDDPDPSKQSTSENCDKAGAFWANVGSMAAAKSYGDAYQNNSCSFEDGCTIGTNSDYDASGYTYVVKVDKPTTNLTIEAFDPAFVRVGDKCEYATANLDGASKLTRSNAPVNDASTRYVGGLGPYCTGDNGFNGTGVRTAFVVRASGATLWDPLTWPAVSGCTRVFDPYSGDLAVALDRKSSGYRSDVAEAFRRWVPLCTFHGLTQPGLYAVQVYTNGLGADSAAGHNRFALRAYGTGQNDPESISISGNGKMGMYGNTPSGTSRFYLARVPSGSGGHSLNINLFDIGDGAVTGSRITVIPPEEVGGSFTGCTGRGVITGSMPTCVIPVSSAFNGKWQTVSVPIPESYSCNDTEPEGCWVRLEFYYGSGSEPLDTTSWTAALEGDPVRLVE